MRTPLEVQRQAMAGAEPGLDALVRGLEATGRWALANRSLAELLFWRPVPSFEPSPEAMEPSYEMLALQRRALAEAVAAGQLGPGGDTEEAHAVVAVLIKGVITQAFANEPDLPWGTGRFTPLFPKLMAILPALYPPASPGPS
jgi:hypothetical protein